MAVVEPVMVDEHTLGKLVVALTLHLHMDQDPRFLTIAQPHLEQLISVAAPDRRFPNNLLEFCVESLVITGPVDRRVHPWKEKRQEGREELLQRILPRGIEVAQCRPPGHRRL